jgi:hypothetical protein
MEPNSQDPTLPFVDQADPESRPLPPDVQALHDRVGGLESTVRGLSQLVSTQARSGPNGRPSTAGQRFSPLVRGGELVALADWVDFYQEYYDIGTMWLEVCWWRHTKVVQELAALHGAWMAVYQSDEPVHGAAALEWHEAAVRTRERIRETMHSGTGCSVSSHRADDPMARDRFWIEEGRSLRRWVDEDGSDDERRAARTRDRSTFKSD